MTIGRIPSVEGGIQPTIVDAKGDLIVATAADTVSRLAVGSANQVLTVDSSTSTGLKWAAPAGGGKVLQVVNATYSTEILITTANTYTDTGLTASITPSSATSKVLVLVSQTGIRRDSTGTVGLRLYRGATNIVQIEKEAADYATSGRLITGGTSTCYLDSPATTSSITYKTQFADTSGGTTGVRINSGPSTSTITLLEIGA